MGHFPFYVREKQEENVAYLWRGLVFEVSFLTVSKVLSIPMTKKKILSMVGQ